MTDAITLEEIQQKLAEISAAIKENDDHWEDVHLNQQYKKWRDLVPRISRGEIITERPL